MGSVVSAVFVVGAVVAVIVVGVLIFTRYR
jgi:hypothetical protein